MLCIVLTSFAYVKCELEKEEILFLLERWDIPYLRYVDIVDMHLPISIVVSLSIPNFKISRN